MGIGYGPGKFSWNLTGSGEAQVFPVTSTVTMPVVKKALAFPAMSLTITESLYRPHISGSRVDAPEGHSNRSEAEEDIRISKKTA